MCKHSYLTEAFTRRSSLMEDFSKRITKLSREAIKVFRQECRLSIKPCKCLFKVSNYCKCLFSKKFKWCRYKCLYKEYRWSKCLFRFKR